MKRVLWIDDDADTGLASFLAPLIFDPDLHLQTATNASEAVESLSEDEFDAVIIDVRLPPGSATEWIDLYRMQSVDSGRPRLGLALLRSLLQPESGPIQLQSIPAWVTPKRFGLLTVESFHEFRDELGRLDLLVRQKQADTSAKELRELIDSILARSE